MCKKKIKILKEIGKKRENILKFQNNHKRNGIFNLNILQKGL